MSPIIIGMSTPLVHAVDGVSGARAFRTTLIPNGTAAIRAMRRKPRTAIAPGWREVDSVSRPGCIVRWLVISHQRFSDGPDARRRVQTTAVAVAAPTLAASSDLTI